MIFGIYVLYSEVNEKSCFSTPVQRSTSVRKVAVVIEKEADLREIFVW